MKRILLAGAAFAALTSASYAADLAYEPAPVVDTWSGYFIGIQGGFAWGDLSVDDVASDTELYSADIEGGFGGGYWGRNWQSGNFVYGLEGSVSFANLEQDDFDADTDTPDVTIEAFSTSRIKLGYAFNDNFMIFAAGGFTLAKANVDDGIADDDAWLKGFTVGAGLEAKFAQNWSARIEYMYLDYGSEQRTIFDGAGIPYDVNVENVNLVRGGIAYHF